MIEDLAKVIGFFMLSPIIIPLEVGKHLITKHKELTWVCPNCQKVGCGVCMCSGERCNHCKYNNCWCM